jgi:hypothetical protein
VENKMREKTTNISSSKKGLLILREELSQIQTPAYPNEFLPLIKRWIENATPTIKHDWSQYFEEFQKCATLNNAESFLAIARWPGVSDSELGVAWNKDNKEAQRLQQNILNFLDGLLTIPSEQKSSELKIHPISYILVLAALVAIWLGVFWITKSITSTTFIFLFAISSFLLISAFMLRQQNLLSEKGFIRIVEMVDKKITDIIKWAGKGTGKGK